MSSLLRYKKLATLETFADRKSKFKSCYHLKVPKRNSSTLKHLVCSRIPENDSTGRFDSDGVVDAYFGSSLLFNMR